MNKLISVVFIFTLITCAPMKVQAVDVIQELTNKIAEADKRLANIERKISNERRLVAGELRELEQDVIVLRQKTAIARRMADESTLSLSQLEKRLSTWQQQNVYQQNLLKRFLQTHTNYNGDNDQLSVLIDLVAKSATETKAGLSPEWHLSDIVMLDGKLEQHETLTIGPVTYFIEQDSELAGIASRNEQAMLRVELYLSGTDQSSITNLHRSGHGEAVFDPTLSRALAQEQNQESLAKHIEKGGLWVLPILIFAMLSLVIAVLKSVQLAKLPRIEMYTSSVVKRMIQGGDNSLISIPEGMQKRLIDIVKQFSSEAERDDQLFIQLQRDRAQLERWIGVIAITASVSPLLGLLGTVSGMIETFNMMTLFGSGDPEVVSGGIAQALVTTELGLVVAIPALVLNAVLSRRAKSYYQALENFALTLSTPDKGQN